MVRLRRRAAISLALLGAALMFSTEASAASPEGEWLVNGGTGRVRITDCGGALWGIVTWESVPGVDDQNPNAALRNRPILGMPVLLELRERSTGQWWGHIYNSTNGRTYSGGVRLKSPDVLRITGCVLGILCGGQDWTRVADASPGPGPDEDGVCTRLASQD